MSTTPARSPDATVPADLAPHIFSATPPVNSSPTVLSQRVPGQAFDAAPAGTSAPPRLTALIASSWLGGPSSLDRTRAVRLFHSLNVPPLHSPSLTPSPDSHPFPAPFQDQSLESLPRRVSSLVPLIHTWSFSLDWSAVPVKAVSLRPLCTKPHHHVHRLPELKINPGGPWVLPGGHTPSAGHSILHSSTTGAALSLLFTCPCPPYSSHSLFH